MLKYLFLVALVVYSANAHVIELLERIIEPILGVEDPNMQKRQDTEHGIQLLDQLLQNENLLDIRTGRSRRNVGAIRDDYRKTDLLVFTNSSPKRSKSQ